MLSALGFARYSALTRVGGCPRCNGALTIDGCLMCGYAGPTHVARPGEGLGRPVQTSKHTRTRMPRSDVSSGAPFPPPPPASGAVRRSLRRAALKDEMASVRDHAGAGLYNRKVR